MGLDWRIYYADGSTFDNLQGTPANSPDRGVIVIVYNDRIDHLNTIGRICLNLWDWYFWREDDREWYGCDSLSVTHYFRQYARVISCLRTGETLPTPKYKAIMERATNDLDFSLKQGERKLGMLRKV